MADDIKERLHRNANRIDHGINDLCGMAAVRIAELEGEMGAIKHDVERYMATANEYLAENERLREALTAADNAIREYNRYWYGGETRGSYDGKPEREHLWKAGYATSAALNQEAGRG